MNHNYTEDHLVEQPAIALLRDGLGWTCASCYDEWASGPSTLGREAKRDVVMVDRLRPALERLNPDISREAITGTVDELTRDRSALSPGEANRESGGQQSTWCGWSTGVIRRTTVSSSPRNFCT